jgi:hypothetical protein
VVDVHIDPSTLNMLNKLPIAFHPQFHILDGIAYFQDQKSIMRRSCSPTQVGRAVLKNIDAKEISRASTTEKYPITVCE